MKWRLSVDEILPLLKSGQTRGHYAGEITGMADLRTAREGEMSFLGSGKYARFLSSCQASVVLVPDGQEGEPAAGQLWILVDNPSLALARVCEEVERRLLPRAAAGIHPSAIVDPSARVDASASIGPHCVIEKDAEVGAGVVVESNVRIQAGAVIGEGTFLQHGVFIGWGCKVGARCRLFPGVVIGADGFGFHSDRSGHQRLAQVGIVVIGDDVEVGADSCLGRALRKRASGRGPRSITWSRSATTSSSAGTASCARVWEFPAVWKSGILWSSPARSALPAT